MAGDEDEIELGAYEPQPAGLSEGDAFIFDRAEFEQDFNCYAVMSRGGQLWILDKETRRWLPVEPPEPAEKASRKLKTVQ